MRSIKPSELKTSYPLIEFDVIQVVRNHKKGENVENEVQRIFSLLSGKTIEDGHNEDLDLLKNRLYYCMRDEQTGKRLSDEFYTSKE